METIELNISFLTARSVVKWTKAKAMCAYVPIRKKEIHIDNIKAIKKWD